MEYLVSSSNGISLNEIYIEIGLLSSTASESFR